MALHPLRLRRALSLSFSLLNRSLQGPKPVSCGLLSTPLPTHTVTATPFSIPWTPRFFTSTNALSRKIFDPATDEIGPDTILLEGCDFNHWLITMDFPKDSNITHDQMIETYVNTAAQIFGSVEEAKKKIYALSTTTYQGFQVLCSEETSEKFKDLPGVVFVLPDSYIDAVNKEYGGDKYVNGEVVPRPNPVYFGRKSYRERRPTEQNFESPPQQNYGPGPRPQQNYVPDPRPQQNYVPDPRPQQNYGPGPRPQQNYEPQPPQNYGQSPQQNYSPPQQSNVPWPQQSYGQTATPQSFGQNVPQNYAPQNYGRSPHQNYSPPQQSNVPWPQQSYGQTPTPQSSGQNVPQNYAPQNYGQSPQQNYSPPQQSNVPWPQQSYGQTPTPQSSGQNVPQNYAPQNYGQSPQQNYSPPQQSNVPWPQQSYGQTPTPQSFGQDVPQNYGNSSNFPPQQNFSPTGSREGNPLPSYRGTFNQPEPMNQYGQGQRNSQSHEPLEQRGPLLQIFTRWTF